VKGFSATSGRGRLLATALLLACLSLSLLGEARATDRDSAQTARTRADVVGASISYPAEWSLGRERHTFDETYGFTLWEPEPGSLSDHGGRPAVRVALAYGMRPDQIDVTVRERIDAYPDLPVRRETVAVAEKGYEGVAVGPVPGSTPSTEVYVPVNGRVYLINVYGEELGEEGERLLSDLRFYPPSRTVESLGLPDADAPGAFRASGEERLLGRELSDRAALASGGADEASAPLRTGAASGGGEEAEIAEGCWRADPDFFVQTQHGMYSNRDWYPKVAAEHSGWTKVGEPNFWGEYTHGSVGYGRCNRPSYTNDKFAVDYPLDRGDAVFSPFECGTVTFAGRNTTHQDYGILVSIEACNGKYVSLSAHLSGLADGIREGTKIDATTIIGYAGATGGPNFPVGYPHLHQAYYRQPSYNPDGSPYGGAGLKVIYHHFVGTAAGRDPGVYQFGRDRTNRIKAKGSWVSN
jgi:hypothetical protein